MTLNQALFPAQSLMTRIAMVVAGSALIAIAAQISVPMFPVPMTLQTLAILIVGLSFGSRLGALTVLAYLAEGAAGLPVFANGGNTAALAGPTAGFLVGFVGLAWLAGFAVQRGLSNLPGMAVAGLVASALLYIPGIAWPMLLASAAGVDAGWAGGNVAYYWGGFMAPFLIGDAVKAVIAALVVAGGWSVLKARKAG